jgi:glycosyltransferase involved in cell wall biosynthesis
MSARPAVVVLVPIQPSSTGNGLAMRADLLVQAAACHHDVHLVVVPVAGRPPIVRPTVTPTSSVEVPLKAAGDRSTVVDWLRDPTWRDALARLTPLLPPVAAAPPVPVAADVVGHLAGRPVVGVLAARLSLGLPAVAVARRLAVPLVLDADDDDEGLHRARGADRLADRWAEVAQVAFAGATEVLAGSPGDAATLALRHGRPVRTVPNAVPLPAAVLPRPARSDAQVVLVVGTLTYGPNIEGARWLVHEVLPLLPPAVRLHLVGPAAPPVRALAEERVVVHDAVDDLDPVYAAAGVVAVPVRHGSGTRIKVLEAFARGRPVVSTRLGAAGLEVRDGHDLLLADEPEAFAAALLAALDAEVGARLVASARALVAEAYDVATVCDDAGRLLAHAYGTPTG